MTPAEHTDADALIVNFQLARPARAPWRVGARCAYGYPTVIVSPARLEDGSPFPTYAWLTCPWLAGRAAAEESDGGGARWAAAAMSDGALAAHLRAADDAVRALRAAEGGEIDECATVGLAGQRDPLGVKCIHAHVALALVGIDDPIGSSLLQSGRECPDRYCDRFAVTKEGG